ncbi:DUF6644 family protein [Pedobacter sp.]|uniref:DUF6644 family protein n=1 Tax=Pedobacter sp. TaxID=1411316 RepID=UPI003D7F3E90
MQSASLWMVKNTNCVKLQPFINPWLAWLEDSAWAHAIRQSLWLYPALEIIHIMGIVLLVGAAFLFDLRLLGYNKNLALAELATYLLPISRKGLFLIIPSGILLFITNAKSLGIDPTFWLKMLLLLIAALNVWVFHRFIYTLPLAFSFPDQIPFVARLSAVISIVSWMAIIACGRLLAY